MNTTQHHTNNKAATTTALSAADTIMSTADISMYMQEYQIIPSPHGNQIYPYQICRIVQRKS